MNGNHVKIRGHQNTNLIVSPGQHDIIQAAVRLVNTVLRGENRISVVRVALERLRVYDLLREGTAYDERILHNT